MASKDQYPRMLYRSDEADGAQPVIGKHGVFYKIVDNAKQEAEALKAGYRKTVFAKQK